MQIYTLMAVYVYVYIYINIIIHIYIRKCDAKRKI